MRRRLKKRFFLYLFLPFLLILTLNYCYVRNFVCNTTPSLPYGFYLKKALPLTIGQTVVFCPKHSPVFTEALKRNFLTYGSCPSGTTSLLKIIVAKEGDHVRIDQDGVRINGHLRKNSTRKVVMNHAVPLPYDRYLGQNEFFFMTENPHSFDSRYYGALSFKNLITVEPFFTWE